MASHAVADRSRRGLLALVSVALLLLCVATIVGGRRRGVQCSTLPTSSPADAPVEPAKPVLSEIPPEQPAGTIPSASAAESPTVSGGDGLVRGFVVDARAGDPVPYLIVEMRVDKESERVPTDAGGAFRATRTFAAGKLEIEVLDGSASYGVTKLAWNPRLANAPVRIQIEIGPTFLVRDIGRQRVQESDAWMLRIVQTPRKAGSAGEIAVRDQELSIAVGSDIVWSEVALRFASHEAYARWPKVEFDPVPDFRPRVVVRSTRRCERGLVEVSKTFGLQSLPAVETRDMLLLSGIVRAAGHRTSGPTRVLIRPNTDSRDGFKEGAPDFREVQLSHGKFEEELDAAPLYSVLAWCGAGEPTLLEGALNAKGRHQIRDVLIRALSYPSFEPGAVPHEFQRGSRRGSQIVRARVQGGGNYALPIVDLWEAFAHQRPGDMIETRYDIESIGVDCSPATMGLSWTQILPGDLVPDRLPSNVVARPHRIEWVDRVFDTARVDALVTGGPGGSVVTMQETSLKATWTVVPKTPLRLTVWKDGCEPVGVTSTDFVERGDEHVASVALRAGWGMSITFVVIDAEQKGSGTTGWATKSRERGARKTFSTNFDFLGLPPLPGVGVTSPQIRAESDADGCVLLHASTWPDRLTLLAPGYRLRELRRLQGGGARWIAYMEHDRYDR